MTASSPVEGAAVRPTDYAISGAAPREVVRPATREEVAETLKRASRDGLSVVPWGGGTSLPRERAPERYDLALDLSGLGRIVEHEPEDFTITVECGVTIAALRAHLATHHQELPLEAAHADRATVGGVIAANASGPRRYRFGSPRDRILGARFALGDGTLARTGGKVVKNVAGYAVHRLACGSRGALLAIVEASFKLAPLPPTGRALLVPADASQLADAARWDFLPRLEPAYVSVTPGRNAPFTVTIGLEDDEAWVEEQQARIVARLGEAEVMTSGVAGDHVQWLADLEGREGPRLTFTTAGNTPAALAPVLESGITDFAFHAAAGRLHVFGVIPDARGLVAALAARGFFLIDAAGHDLVSAPPEIAIPTLRARIREVIDPGKVFAFGDRWAS